ncbi:MAG: CopD family protein [Bacillota bacterium]
MSLLPAFAIALHLLSAVIWVGGMFFAFLAARPVLAELDTLLRARLWVGIFRRFFPWVWAAVVALLVTGFYMVFNTFDGFAHAPAFVHVMMGLGILMMLLFGHVFFSPYKRLQRSVSTGDEDLAKKAMGQIRRVIGVNLALGLVVILVATLGMYLSSD